MSEQKFNVPFTSPAIPALLTGETVINFRCYPGIACFNRCCKRADITLTPYDVLRLKQRFNVGSEEFLKGYTVPFQMDADGLPGLKLRTNDDGVCLLLNEELGCSVYSDRPIVCRYYPVALLNIREQNSSEAKVGYSLVREDHCRGHEEVRAVSIEEYRVEQGCEEYDFRNQDWYRIILKKKSAGPGVGKPSDMSLQMFFMASFNLDMFRRFVLSENFKRTYRLQEQLYETLARDDLAVMEFGFQFLRQVLFGERSIDEGEGVWERRLQERREIWEQRARVIQAQRALDEPKLS